jgi:hypothetical protein
VGLVQGGTLSECARLATAAAGLKATQRGIPKKERSKPSYAQTPLRISRSRLSSKYPKSHAKTQRYRDFTEDHKGHKDRNFEQKVTARRAATKDRKISRKDAKTQRVKTERDFKQEATEVTEIFVASLSSCLKFLRLGNPRQNERNAVGVVQSSGLTVCAM